MQLLLLAAGHGRRFGGLKQLAPVGPKGEAIMDYTARDALQAGFSEVVLVIREDVRDELLDHVDSYWPREIKVTPVIQGPLAGTAQAVASGGPAIDGSFGVANADDLYGTAALQRLAAEVEGLGPDTHVIVGYRLSDTVLTDAPLTRGICMVDDGRLVEIQEMTVARHEGGAFSGRPLRAGPSDPPEELSGDELVSMNLWGFSEGMFDDLNRALRHFDPGAALSAEGKPPELLLPDVAGALVAAGLARIGVVETAGRCIGITHPDDLPLVRRIVADLERAGASERTGA